MTYAVEYLFRAGIFYFNLVLMLTVRIAVVVTLVLLLE